MKLERHKEVEPLTSSALLLDLLKGLCVQV